MCLNDEECQLVLIAVDPFLPAYVAGLRGLANVEGAAKLLLLGAYAAGTNICNCLRVEEMIEFVSQPSRSSSRILQQRGG